MLMQAYFDCFSGISGDMTLGALIDLGAPVDWLQNELSRLPLNGFKLTVTPVMRNGIRVKFLSLKHFWKMKFQPLESAEDSK